MFFRGTKPIDGVWATDDLTITHTCVMPAGYGVGNHRMFFVDFQEKSLVGITPFRIQWHTLRWLNTKNLNGASKKYLEILEENLSRHCLLECPGDVHRRHESKKAFQREHKLNMKHKKYGNSFYQLFKVGEAVIQSIIAHNVHENIGPTQQGGTGLLLFGHLTE
jgi:hypothetical protein